MSIGIITIHTGYNEGAVLQAYALSRLLREVTGDAVEVLDHRHRTQTDAHYGPANTGRKRGIAAFRDSVLPLSPERFIENPRGAWAYAAKRYRAVVVGSDEVWKIAYRSKLRGLIRVQSDPLAPAYPNAYWPDASAGPMRVAYAATAGAKTDWTRIPMFRRWQMARTVNGFAGLGLRDERTRAFINSIAPEAAARSVRVPDPTLGYDLLPLVETDMPAKLAGLGVDFGRPRVVITAAQTAKTDALIASLRQDGMQTVALSYANPATELDLSQAELSPLDWAAAFGCFDLSISDRMHGCIFSLRNNTPLIVLDARKPTMGLPTKNAEIAERFGIAEFYFPLHRAETTAESLVTAARALISGGWSRDTVPARLDSERALAVGFLGGVFQRVAA